MTFFHGMSTDIYDYLDSAKMLHGCGVLSFDTGEIPAPIGVMDGVPVAKDGWPDKRTLIGKAWIAWFERQSARHLELYRDGKDQEFILEPFERPQ